MTGLRKGDIIFDDVIEHVARLLAKGGKHLDRENYEKAEKAFRKCLRLVPNCGAAYQGLGIVYANNRYYKEAISCFEDAIIYFNEIGGTRGARDSQRYINDIKEQMDIDQQRDADNHENIMKIIRNIFQLME